jgi:uncharacterized protein YqgC (DUF456 family)
VDALWIVALLIVAVGLAGTVVPGLPGMPLVLGGVALYSIGSGFSVVGPLALAGLVGLGLVGLALNYLGGLLGARRFGASRAALLGALAGLVLGLFFPPFGLVLGPLLGALAVELARGRELKAALHSSLGVVVGYLLGSLAEMIVAFVVAALFVWQTAGPATAGLRGGGAGSI